MTGIWPICPGNVRCSTVIIRSEEVESSSTIEVDDEMYTIDYFLGGDMKFLLMACGLNSANGKYACVMSISSAL